MPKGVTPISHQVWDLHMAAFYVCVALGIIVFGALFLSIIKFRRSKGAVAETSWKHNTKVEIAWTIVPVLILIGLAAPATLLTREIYNTTDPQLTVKVTGYQWLWRYDYISYEGKSVTKVPTIWSRLAWNSNAARQLDSGISPYSIVSKAAWVGDYEVSKGGYHDYLFNTTHPLVLPTGIKIRFLITSDDVIHGWGVPDLAIKKAAIPGIMNDAWAKIEKPGVYYGQCYVLCGQDHSAMPVEIEAVPQAVFNAWLAEQENRSAASEAGRTAQAAVPKSTPGEG